MAVTKILARKGRLDIGIDYILNGDKDGAEDPQPPIRAVSQAGNAVRCWRRNGDTENMGGVQYYHIVQSFKPGERSLPSWLWKLPRLSLRSIWTVTRR